MSHFSATRKAGARQFLWLSSSSNLAVKRHGASTMLSHAAVPQVQDMSLPETATALAVDVPAPSETLRELYQAYRAQYPSVSSAEFERRLLAGVVVCADVDLQPALRLVRQCGELADASVTDLRPIQSQRIQTLLDQLVALTLRDGLTGLFNRRYFDHRFGQELHRAKNESICCSLLLADIDNFKRINEAHGRECGDRVIEYVADILCTSLRTTDEVTARFGGEEFAIILPNTDLRDASQVAERLRSRVEAHRVELSDSGENTLQATVSIGLATYDPRQPLESSEVLSQADAALYEAKASGKNTVRISGSLPDPCSEGVTVEERQALLR